MSRQKVLNVSARPAFLPDTADVCDDRRITDLNGGTLCHPGSPEVESHGSNGRMTMMASMKIFKVILPKYVRTTKHF